MRHRLPPDPPKPPAEKQVQAKTPALCSCGAVASTENPMQMGVTGKWFCRRCHETITRMVTRDYEEAERMWNAEDA